MVDNHNSTVMFVPYSNTFYGRVADACAHFPGRTIVALVLEGEDPPINHYIIIRKDGSFSTPVLPGPDHRNEIVVVNGGPTPLTVAAVRLAQYLGCPAYDIQRDGVIRLAV